MFIELIVGGEETLPDKVRELLNKTAVPRRRQNVGSRRCKSPPAIGIRRNRLDQWLAIEATIAIEHTPSLRNQRLVTEVKWTVEIAEIRVSELVEDFRWIGHASPSLSLCPRNALTAAAILRLTPL
jgi:hypothetical protein